VAKVINVKTPKEVEFEMDSDLDTALNPEVKEVSIKDIDEAPMIS
jgi:hypothetical protein